MSEDPAQAINTTDATEGQQVQADQEINQDPTVEAAGDAPTPDAEPGPYDGLKLEELRAELKRRELPTSGNKDELVARLSENDDQAKNEGEVEGEEEPADQSVNGGIQVDRVFSDAHANTLQELSNARRAAQLKATQG